MPVPGSRPSDFSPLPRKVKPRRKDLRDEFAMSAIGGVMHSLDSEGTPPQLKTGDAVARIAYRIADAMLAAREVKS
jgi:hypothetical protein